MPPIADGNPVNAATTNAAFLYKNADTSTTGSIALINADTAHVDDIQLTINTILEGIGGDQDTVATDYGSTPSNTIDSMDTHEDALGILARKFYAAASAGHTHDGTEGGGGLIERVSGISVTAQPVLTGSVILIPGSNVSMMQSGNNITVSASGGGGGSQKQETPTGLVNNSNTTYTLSESPASDASVSFYIDGLIQSQGIGLDYTISGDTITTAIAPDFGQVPYAVYQF
jgi:hypothetical protein